MAVVLLSPSPVQWECAHCTERALTPWGTVNRFHACRGLAGITAPMVPAGSRCVVTVHEREDYIGTEDVQYDGNGRPVMSVTTTRDDGEDCAVFAPTVHASRSA